MRITTFRLPSAQHADDGVDLFVHRFLPDREGDSVRAIVSIVHGMGEHSARYQPTAQRLVAAGYAVYAHDHRGHGQTAKDPAELGHLADSDGWNRSVADIGAVLRAAEQEHPGARKVLLGHSMGSFMAQQFAIENGDGLSALVLSGSTGDAGPIRRVGVIIAAIEKLRVGRRGHSGILGSLLYGGWNAAFEPVRTDFDWLSRDRHEVARYVDDPLCGFVLRAQSFCDMLQALGWIHTAKAVARVPEALPIYIFSGEEDPIHGGGPGFDRLVASYEAAGIRDLTSRLYERGRHEMLNETNRERVVADLVDWLEKRVG